MAVIGNAGAIFGIISQCRELAAHNLLSIRGLFKVTLVYLLDVQDVLVSAADIVLDHQFG